MYTTFTKTDQGLRITLTAEGVQELEYQRKHNTDLWEHAQRYKSNTDIFMDLIEHQLCNGWDRITAEDIGALTSNETMLSDSAQRNDQGDLEWTDSVYYFADYQTTDPLDLLEQQGYVDFAVEHFSE
jgi:outer membrane receptor for ferric coprogen and ferric-rhodotorulic acid